jgi:hypothetical protein
MSLLPLAHNAMRRLGDDRVTDFDSTASNNEEILGKFSKVIILPRLIQRDRYTPCRATVPTPTSFSIHDGLVKGVRGINETLTGEAFRGNAVQCLLVGPPQAVQHFLVVHNS